MQEIKELLRHFGKQFPFAEPVDYIKLLYQNEFGCGHLCSQGQEALSLLWEEWSGMGVNSDIPLFDSIGNGLCRLNLGALGRNDLPLAAQIFALSAQTLRGDEATFRKKLSLFMEIALNGELPADGGSICETVERYLAQGIRPVHHSESYRKRYAPHYRVVEMRYAVFFPAFQAAQRLLEVGKKPIFAIEGRCASGKTTLAAMLKQIFHCNVLHMDDFFLPFPMRTQTRLSTPGGNVHYERFLSDVLLPLQTGKAFSYRPFCCRDESFGSPVQIVPKPLTVVEGAYSMHPALRKYYGDSVFLTISPKIQQSRILARNGAEMLRVFNERWIPMEEHYFRELKIPVSCGTCIDTGVQEMIFV